MATFNHYTDEQRKNQAERLGVIFGVEDAGMKMTRNGLSIEPWGDEEVLVKVELVQIISRAEADAILNAAPVERGKG